MNYSAKHIATPVATTTCTEREQVRNPFDTLQGLKDRAYRTWKSLYQVHDLDTPTLSATTDKVFKQAMRQFGDLRRKITWENAWCSLYAQLIAETPGNNVRLIKGTFIACAEAEGWAHLMPRVLDNFLEDEDAKACIQDGLEKIFQSEQFFPKELEPFAQALASNPKFQHERIGDLAQLSAA